MERPAQQAQVMVGYITPGLTDPEYPAVRVLGMLLGGGMSGRLFAELRDRRGLAYQVGVLGTYRTGPSFLLTYMGTAPANVEASEKGVLAEIERIRTEPVTERELARAKAYLLGNLAMDRRTIAREAWYLAFFEVIGAGWSFPERYMRAVEAVTTADVARVAQRYLTGADRGGAAAAAQGRRAMIPLKDDVPSQSTPFVTYALIALNVVVYLYQFSLSLDARGPGAGAFESFIMEFGVVPCRLTGACATRGSSRIPRRRSSARCSCTPASSTSLGNMLYLWIFGDNVEDTLGHGRFLVFYGARGAGGRPGQTLVHPDSRVPMVGASGAVSGVLGAYLLLFPGATRSDFADVLRLLLSGSSTIPAIIVLGFWIVVQFVIGLHHRRLWAAEKAEAWRGLPTSAGSWQGCCPAVSHAAPAKPSPIISATWRPARVRIDRLLVEQGADREPREGGPSDPGRRGPGGRPAGRQGRLPWCPPTPTSSCVGGRPT